MMETPYISIDQGIMERNIRSMAESAKLNGVQLRPHIKTHKMPHLAELQMKAGASGITVAKIGEAELMAESGIKDIFMAYPLVGVSKVERVIQLSRSIRISVGVDSLEAAVAISETAGKQQARLTIRLEVDTGLKRTGIVLDEAIKLALEINKLPNVLLNGIFTYRGSNLQGNATLDFQAAGKEEGEIMARLADEMRQQGLAIEHVSLGSTPTARYAGAVKGVTEIRPGTYIFNDRMQSKMGVCGQGDCAAHVVATVVSVQPTGVVIDGGSKTFATDIQLNQPPLNLSGFGYVVGHPDAVFERMNEEHGVIRIEQPHGLKVGDTLDIIPNHICSTINLHNYVYFSSDGKLERVQVAARGLVQ